MVILQIDGEGIGAVPGEGDASISRHPDRLTRLALQRVPVETRQVELLGPGRGIERTQYAAHPRNVRHTQPARVADSKYRLSARLRKLRITRGNLMPKAASVKCRLTSGYQPDGRMRVLDRSLRPTVLPGRTQTRTRSDHPLSLVAIDSGMKSATDSDLISAIPI